jgi:hypothetical protein
VTYNSYNLGKYINIFVKLYCAIFEMKIVSRKRNTQEYDYIKKNVWKRCKLEKSSKFYALKVFQNYFLNSKLSCSQVFVGYIYFFKTLKMYL